MQKAILALREADPVLGELIDRVGPYRIHYLEPNFQALVKSIVYQQLSGKVAARIFSRLLEAGGGTRLTPRAALNITPRQMREAGLSRQKISYIRDIARRVESGELDFAAFGQLPDDEVTRSLTSLKGVGVWTVHMFLIFALRRKDVLPIGDLGIRAAVRAAYHLPELPTPRQVEELGSKWRPYRTVASWYLWRSVEPNANL